MLVKMTYELLLTKRLIRMLHERRRDNAGFEQ